MELPLWEETIPRIEYYDDPAIVQGEIQANVTA
jgi:hypothetical protein